MSTLAIPFGHLVKIHLNFIDYFLNYNKSKDDLSLKIGFSITCLYMWLVQAIYCGLIGLTNVSIICFASSLVYLMLMYMLKKKIMSKILFSRGIILISILNLHLCYLNAGAYLNPTIVWLMAIPVCAVTLTGLKEGALWSLLSSAMTIILMEIYHQMGWTYNEWSKQHIYEVGQSNMFTGPLLFYIMFGFFYFSRNKYQQKIAIQTEMLQKVATEKEKLLNVIFHDLGRNTSLLSGYLEMSEQKNLTKQEKAKVFRHTEEIKEILKNAKDLDTHRIINTNETLRLYEIYQNLNKLYEEQLNSKRLQFEFVGDNTKTIHGNKSHIQSHILGNLLSNAIKFSYEDTTIKLQVEDSSISLLNKGLPFSPNQRIGTNGETGSGIGLEIVKDYCLKNNLEFSISTSDNETISKIQGFK